MAAVAGLVVVFQAPGSGQQNPAPIGFVLEVAGSWLVNGRPARLGEQVAAEARVTLATDPPASSGARIQIVLLNNKVFTRTCRQVAGCRALDLPGKLTAGRGLASQVIEVVQRLFGTKAERFVPVLSRGPADPVLRRLAHDGLYELRDGAVVIAEPLQSLCRRAHGLTLSAEQLTPLGEPLGPGTPTAGTVTADPSCTSAQGAALVAGLYRFVLVDERGAAPAPTGVEFWAVLRTINYAAGRIAFARAEEAVRGWGDSSETARRTFLRAYLVSLASASSY